MLSPTRSVDHASRRTGRHVGHPIEAVAKAIHDLEPERTAGVDGRETGFIQRHDRGACSSAPSWVMRLNQRPPLPAFLLPSIFTTTTSKHTASRSPCTSSRSKPTCQCAPHQVSSPCVADQPIFYTTCPTRRRTLDNQAAAFHQPPCHAHSPRPHQPPPNHNSAGFLSHQPVAFQSCRPKPEPLGPLPCSRNSSLCVTTSPTAHHHQSPYQPQYHTPQPRDRAPVPLFQQPEVQLCSALLPSTPVEWGTIPHRQSSTALPTMQQPKHDLALTMTPRLRHARQPCSAKRFRRCTTCRTIWGP